MNRKKYLGILAIVTLACIIGGSLLHGSAHRIRLQQRMELEQAMEDADDESPFAAIDEFKDEMEEAAKDMEEAREDIEDAGEDGAQDPEDAAKDPEDGEEGTKEELKDARKDAAEQKADSKSNDSDQTKHKETVLPGTQKDKKAIPFDSIVLDVGISDILLQTGDDYSVTYYAKQEEDIPEAEIKNGVLTIKQKEDLKFSMKDLESFIDGRKMTMTITVPEGNGLKTADLDVGVGDLNLDQVEISDLKIDNGTGDVEIDGCSFDRLQADSGTGDIRVSGVKNLSEYRMKLESGTGNLIVEGRKIKGTDYKVEIASDKEINLDTGTGDLSVNP